MNINNKTVFFTGIILILIVVSISLLSTKTNTKHNNRQAKYTNPNNVTNQQVNQYQYTEITVKKLQEILRKKNNSISIVDIRSTGIFEKEHIISSINLPADTLLSGGVAPKYDKDIIVVLFDEIDANTINKAVQIIEKSNKNVKVLSGGMSVWKNSGGTTLTIGDPTSVSDVIKTQFIDKDTVKEIIQKKKNNEDRNYVIVDIRPEIQYKNGHLPYAINIPLITIEKTFRQLPPTKSIIVYGSLQRDSFSAGVQLYDLGLSRVHILENGYIDWVRANYDIVNP